MKKVFLQYFCLIMLLPVLSNCARDLSSNVYTSDSTQSFTMEGQVISTRKVVVKNTDKVENNSLGMLSGGAMGAAAGSSMASGGRGDVLLVVGGVVAGGVIGALAQGKLGETEGYEYIVKLKKPNIKEDQYFDGSIAMRNVMSAAISTGLITIVQGTDSHLSKGQKVYVIVSDKRTRIIST